MVETLPGDKAALRLPAVVSEAAFFGGCWEYVVELRAGGLPLRVGAWSTERDL